MRHPEDATLFDLVEGTLDPARAEVAELHLARCAACAAFVRAARVGAPTAETAVEPMPSEAAGRMQVALSAAWRERVAGIAADEATQDAAPRVDPGLGSSAGFAPTTPLVPEEFDDAAAPESRRRRGRRLVPVLAFVVLGTLAGTSIYVGERGDSGGDTASMQDVERSTDESSRSEPSPDSVTSGGLSEAPAGGSSEAAPETPPASAPGAPAQPDDSAESAVADAAKEALEGDGRSAAGTSATTVTAVPPEGEQVDDLECIATRDETQLAMPDGRLAQQILTAPFGIYVVCG